MSQIYLPKLFVTKFEPFFICRPNRRELFSFLVGNITTESAPSDLVRQLGVKLLSLLLIDMASLQVFLERLCFLLDKIRQGLDRFFLNGALLGDLIIKHLALSLHAFIKWFPYFLGPRKLLMKIITKKFAAFLNEFSLSINSRFYLIVLLFEFLFFALVVRE